MRMDDPGPVGLGALTRRCAFLVWRMLRARPWVRLAVDSLTGGPDEPITSVAAAPKEWAMTPLTGPQAWIAVRTASLKRRRSARCPGERPWAGPSMAATRKPARSSGSTKPTMAPAPPACGSLPYLNLALLA